MQEMGVTVIDEENGILVRADKPLRAVDVKTLPHPGFPTDMQSQMMALLLAAEGTSIVTETVFFENRFMHVAEFRKMNAQIKVEGRTAVVTGQVPLSGASVCATDLRAGAALILAALIADGETEITGLHHIDRGYIDIEEKFRALGADLFRVADPAPVQLPLDAGRLTVQPTWA